MDKTNEILDWTILALVVLTLLRLAPLSEAVPTINGIKQLLVKLGYAMGS
ncbi:MAG TPA: hypothetical protein PL001_00080 [Candidatus Kryptobacter bacterium]|nr:hypothetical protein [Candidatus Kryptobacter bacterium]